MILTHDIEPININCAWKKSSNSYDPKSCFFVKLKDKYLYRNTYISNLPEYEDLLLAIELTSEPIPILTTPHTSYCHEAQGHVPSTSTLLPRAFEKYQFEQDVVNLYVRKNSLTTYIVQKTKYKAPEGDISSSYTVISLPLNHFEYTLYINGLQLFESYHLTYSQAIAQHFQIRFKRIDDALNDTSKYAIRFNKYSIGRYNRAIYSLNRQFINRTIDLIFSSVKATVIVSDPDQSYRKVNEQLGIRLIGQNVANGIPEAINPNSLVNLLRIICITYTNPNLIAVTFKEYNQLPDFNVQTMIGILVAQNLFYSSMITDSSRLFCNNYIAGFISLYCLSADFKANHQNLSYENLSNNMWFDKEDKIFIMYQMRHALGAVPITNFSNAYFGLAAPVLGTSDETVWLNGSAVGRFLTHTLIIDAGRTNVPGLRQFFNNI